MIKYSKDKMINFSILPSCKPYKALKLGCKIQFSYFLFIFLLKLFGRAELSNEYNFQVDFFW